MIECEARRRTIRRIKVVNVLASSPGAPPATLAVKTDLGCLLGAANVRVGSTPVDYELSVQSPVGGTFYGSVTFTDEKSGEVCIIHCVEISLKNCNIFASTLCLKWFVMPQIVNTQV